MRRSTAFTLIELLVVIAIIALLVGIMLPALAKARKASQLAVSLSNIRQISLAQVTYRNENKDYIPYPIHNNGTAVWVYGGTFCNVRWTGSYADVAPRDRPLNSYIYPGAEMNLPAVSSNRDKLPLNAFRSPGDKATVFDMDGTSGEPSPIRTTYEDVGTSYLQNHYVWRLQQPAGGWDTLNGWIDGWRYASRKLSSGNVDAGKLVMFSDKIAFCFIADDATPNRRWQSEFEGINKSVMGFLDGHADYIVMERRPDTPMNPYNHYGFGSLTSGGNNTNDRPFQYSYILPPRRN